MRCTNCGTENPAGTQFCGNCGTPLGDAPAASTPAKSGKGRMFLIIGGVIAAVVGLGCMACLALVLLSGGSPGKTADVSPTDQPKPTSAPATRTVAVPTNAPAPTSTAAPQPKSTVGKIGDRVESAGIAVTVVKASKVNQIGSFTKPKAGNMLLNIEVIIENTNRDKAPYNPLYFKVRDSNGFEYNTTITALDPSLKSGDVAQGEKVRGNVAFEVKSDAKGLVVSYEPLVLLGGYQAIKIDLGQ
jgi:hypothetical protein